MIINGKVLLNDMLAKEKLKQHNYGARRVDYRDVWLLDTSEFEWVASNKGEVIYEWPSLALGFYFPVDRQIKYIGISNCLECFTNPQIANIISYVKRVATKKRDEYPDLRIPRFLEAASDLVGAALTHQ